MGGVGSGKTAVAAKAVSKARGLPAHSITAVSLTVSNSRFSPAIVQARGIRTHPSILSVQPAISARPSAGIAPVLRANSRAAGVMSSSSRWAGASALSSGVSSRTSPGFSAFTSERSSIRCIVNINMTDALKARDAKDVEDAVRWALSEGKTLEVAGRALKATLRNLSAEGAQVGSEPGMRGLVHRVALGLAERIVGGDEDGGSVFR